MTRLAVVITESALSTKSGEGIPIHFWINYLSRSHTLDLFILSQHSGPIPEEIFSRAASCTHLYLPRRKSLVTSLLSEIVLKRFWFPKKTKESFKTNFMSRDYKIILASPIISVAFVSAALEQSDLEALSSIAVTSDLYWKTQKFIALESTSPLVRILAKMRLLSAKGLEKLALTDWSTVIVQSEVERSWLSAEYPNRKQVLALPNGTTLGRELVQSNKTCDLLFWGDDWKSASSYSSTVISAVLKVDPSLRVVVLGTMRLTTLSDDMRDRLIIVRSVKDLGGLLSSVQFAILPTFKPFGLINRVLESMAAGCVVIADGASFNGIVGFESGVHGFAINDGKTAARTVINLLCNRSECRQVAERAKLLVATNHSWRAHKEFAKSLVALGNAGADC